MAKMWTKTVVPLGVALIATTLAVLFWLRPDGDLSAFAPAPPTATAAPSPDLDLLTGDIVAAPDPAQWATLATRITPRQPSFEPLDEPLAPRLAELRLLAKNGDALAATQLYAELSRCAAVPGLLIEAGRKLDDPAAIAGPGPGSRAQRLQEDAERLLSKHEHETALCAGVGPDDLAERYRWIELAASRGLPDATMLFLADGSAVLTNAAAAFRNPEELVRVKAQGARFLQAAAQRCHLDSLFQLADAYHEGTWLPANSTLANAFSVVSIRLSGGGDSDPLQGASASAMPPAERARIEQVAQRIYMRYCR